jgi:hypothetical protein
MAYNKAGDGRVIQRGKTNAQVFPTDGPKVIDKGPKKMTSSLNSNFKSMGRNLARVANQRGR